MFMNARNYELEKKTRNLFTINETTLQPNLTNMIYETIITGPAISKMWSSFLSI